MANYGIGLGSFVDGLIGGMKAREAIETSKSNRKIKEGDAAWTTKERARTEQGWQREDQQRDFYKNNVDTSRSAYNAEVNKAVTSGYSAEEGGWKIGGQLYKTEAEANNAVQGQIGTFFDYYMKNAAPKVAENFLREGQPDKAKAWQTWLSDTNVQAGMRDMIGASRAAMFGDLPSFVALSNKALGNSEYGGGMMSIADARQSKDDKGNVTGIDVDFVDRGGKKTTQSFKSNDDLYRYIVMFGSPESVFKYATNELQSGQKTRQALAAEQRKNAFTLQRDENTFQNNLTRDQIKHQMDVAEKVATARGKGEDVETVRKNIETIRGKLAQEDLKFSKLSVDEQYRKAAEAYLTGKAQAIVTGGVTPGQQTNTTTKGVIVSPDPRRAN